MTDKSMMNEWKEWLALINKDPIPRCLHMNPKYLEELKGLIPSTVAMGSNVSGLPIHLSNAIETWMVEYSDGTFKLPENAKKKPYRSPAVKTTIAGAAADAIIHDDWDDADDD